MKCCALTGDCSPHIKACRKLETGNHTTPNFQVTHYLSPASKHTSDMSFGYPGFAPSSQAPPPYASPPSRLDGRVPVSAAGASRTMVAGSVPRRARARSTSIYPAYPDEIQQYMDDMAFPIPAPLGRRVGGSSVIEGVPNEMSGGAPYVADPIHHAQPSAFDGAHYAPQMQGPGGGMALPQLAPPHARNGRLGPFPEQPWGVSDPPLMGRHMPLSSEQWPGVLAPRPMLGSDARMPDRRLAMPSHTAGSMPFPAHRAPSTFQYPEAMGESAATMPPYNTPSNWGPRHGLTSRMGLGGAPVLSEESGAMGPYVTAPAPAPPPSYDAQPPAFHAPRHQYGPSMERDYSDNEMATISPGGGQSFASGSRHSHPRPPPYLPQSGMEDTRSVYSDTTGYGYVSSEDGDTQASGRPRKRKKAKRSERSRNKSVWSRIVGG
ncbi:hypothetical protein OH76DRAFT_1039715 [Lentinus brumalis]|uniref:Uncharacterized protein n=1 Tax=Lentinus brumalis TaxID=2498619 RepID=A0A371CWZ8_9APHY|nr:hypothetical protein OH76DRAFT_1039715 [Polyporus brumalis]